MYVTFELTDINFISELHCSLFLITMYSDLCFDLFTEILSGMSAMS